MAELLRTTSRYPFSNSVTEGFFCLFFFILKLVFKLRDMYGQSICTCSIPQLSVVSSSERDSNHH